MPQFYPDNRFPPVIKGKISEIYPWIGFGADHLIYLISCLRKSLKINSENQTVDRTIKDFFVCPNVYLLDSGRSAILIALKALGLKPGDEILLSAFNCTAVAEAIKQAGGIIRFVDINSEAGLNFDSLTKAIGPRTKGLIVTHIYGLVDNLEELHNFCKSQNIFLINDLAQTLEHLAGPKLNTYGDVALYSFGPEKHLFALGGGALVTHRQDLTAPIEKNLPVETVSDGSLFLVLAERWKYYFTFFALKRLSFVAPILKRLGAIYTFSPLKTIQLGDQSIKPRLMHPGQKSVLAKKLRSYDADLTKTIENFNHLRNNLNIRLISSDSALPLYATLRVNPRLRFDLAEYLAKRGIQTVWNYYPLYKAGSFGPAELPATEKLWQEVLSIPFRYPMTTKRLNQICEIVNDYADHANSRD